MLKRQLLIFITALLVSRNVNAVKELSDGADNPNAYYDKSTESRQPRATIEDLFEILKKGPVEFNSKEVAIEVVPEKILKDKDSSVVNMKVDLNPSPTVVNLRDRSSIDDKMIVGVKQAQADIKKLQTELATEPTSDVDKKKINENNELLQEIRRELENLRNVRAALKKKSTDDKMLSDFEKDELLYRSLLQRQHSLKQRPQKRFLLPAGGACTDRLTKKVHRMHAAKLLKIEKSRIAADRVAELALNVIKRKQRLMECLGMCGCDTASIDDSSSVVLVEEAGKKRDVEISSSSASSSTLDASVGAGGVNIDSSVNKASASEVNIDTPLGSSSTSISSSISTDVHVDKGGLGGGIGIGANVGLGLGLGGKGLYRYLTTCEDYERKMIMDMSIEDAASMIRRMAYETRGGRGVCDEDPNFEKKVLKLAIELVNKVTYDSSSPVDLLSSCRYKTVDDYLKTSLYRAEQGDEDDSDLYDGYEPYGGHPLYNCCSEYDVATGTACPECMRRQFMAYRRRRQQNPAYYYELK